MSRVHVCTTVTHNYEYHQEYLYQLHVSTINYDLNINYTRSIKPNLTSQQALSLYRIDRTLLATDCLLLLVEGGMWDNLVFWVLTELLE